MQIYFIITILQFAFIICGFVITKVTTQFRRNRAITKTQALIGYGVSMVCFIGMPMILKVLAPFISKLLGY